MMEDYTLVALLVGGWLGCGLLLALSILANELWFYVHKRKP